ncbi:hypothetical protein [Mesorhizobium wenxiniae]|uniref:Uncharacterized protein n=1 Tax=Mesorhizobium wenxiniae TaxID=2014805 RepID=A0A271K931_9HYPH|nr:hypothetical protein [Mesorhizobium wenxiniae]PAP92160.1 hypothetical protein CIT31_29840 [Mesorhizobium wenxiniae]
MSGALPVGGTTGLCHESTSAIDQAAEWLSLTPRRQRDKPAVPLLRERFGLTAPEACQAMAAANLIKARST